VIAGRFIAASAAQTTAKRISRVPCACPAEHLKMVSMQQFGNSQLITRGEME
jgi:hypothetical protein